MNLSIKPLSNLKNPTVAPYANIRGATTSITEIVNNVSHRKRLAIGKDSEMLEALVGKALVKRKETIACAESCTGGLLSKRLTDIPGSSRYIKLNVITYSNESKCRVLNVPKHLIEKFGAISKEVAERMAIGIKALARTNIGISITGIAGPEGGSKEKPVGLVYFGLATDSKVETREVLFDSNLTRDEIKWLATQYALNWIKKELHRVSS